MSVPGFSRRSAASALVKALNADLGTAYDTARLGQWRRAERPIPQPVQDWMLRACVAHAVEACGGRAPSDEERLGLLATMLCPPKREETTQEE